jgi:hypothetical protein
MSEYALHLADKRTTIIDKDFVCDNPERLFRVAKAVNRVMRVAYAREFEERTLLVLPGEVAAYQFDELSGSLVIAAQKRIESHTKKGSVYHILDMEFPGALVKATPMYESKFDRFMPYIDPHCYVNDVAVTQEGEGVGSYMLATALKRYNPDSKTVLDAYDKEDQDRVNSWFERLGFKPIAKQPSDLCGRIGNTLVPQTRLEAESIGEVLEKLQKKS